MRTKVLFLTIAPPENHCGVRVVMYRHLVERQPFEVLVGTNAEYATGERKHVKIELPYLLRRLRKTRFGPLMRKWITDFENLVWPYVPGRVVDRAIQSFQPDIVLALTDNHLSEIARRAALRRGLPLAGLFLDWVPVMEGYYGHAWTCNHLSRRFRRYYRECDLAFCTSDGMIEELGPHPNAHVLYPMPGRHRVPARSSPLSDGKFRLVYVGSVENFYGRMLCSLLNVFAPLSNLEILVVGPNADWPSATLDAARARGIYLGFKPPEEAAAILAGADALLVLMSFEESYRLFMRTSFTTKFLDYAAFGKPIVVWGPPYCTPVRLTQREGGAAVVTDPDPNGVLAVCRRIASEPAYRAELSRQARHLHATLFNPDRLQRLFVEEIEKLALWGHAQPRETVLTKGGGAEARTYAKAESV